MPLGFERAQLLGAAVAGGALPVVVALRGEVDRLGGILFAGQLGHGGGTGIGPDAGQVGRLGKVVGESGELGRVRLGRQPVEEGVELVVVVLTAPPILPTSPSIRAVWRTR